jgi:glutamate 5-kinase
MKSLTFKRIVIKIGSSTITGKNRLIREKWLKSVAKDIKSIKGKTEVIIVTSGAAALGAKSIAKTGKLKLEEKQAACAIGQIALMQAYVNAFRPLPVAQILLTISNTEKRHSYLNAKNSIETIIKAGALPVINENDVVATAELKYGDNDRLSARVAQMLGADLLIIFSDIDGLYTRNPKTDIKAKHIDVVEEITRDIEKMATGGSSSEIGTGGMVTKIEAAKIAVRAGCDTIITNGDINNPIRKLLDGKVKYTHFKSRISPLTARKQWIVSGVKPMGEIEVDSGAATALLKGKSLLPAGATRIWGEFERGDLVIVKAGEQEVARGLTAYSSEDARKITGKKTSELEHILGFTGRNALIHRDDMVITTNS